MRSTLAVLPAGIPFHAHERRGGSAFDSECPGNPRSAPSRPSDGEGEVSVGEEGEVGFSRTKWTSNARRDLDILVSDCAFPASRQRRFNLEGSSDRNVAPPRPQCGHVECCCSERRLKGRNAETKKKHRSADYIIDAGVPADHGAGSFLAISSHICTPT